MTVTRHSTATPEQVWEVLANGWQFAGWVVGASRIRAVDKNWPEQGSRISHSVGTWPALLNDETVVESARPTRELVLHAKALPIGKARITMRIFEAPRGCRIEMDEVATTAPLNKIPRRIQDVTLWQRNHECVLRLALIAEGKTPDELS